MLAYATHHLQANWRRQKETQGEAAALFSMIKRCGF